MTSPLVTYAVDGRVGVVSLNRGDKLNAISGDLKRALVESEGNIGTLRRRSAAIAPVHGPCPRDITSQTRTPAPGARCHSTRFGLVDDPIS